MTLNSVMYNLEIYFFYLNEIKKKKIIKTKQNKRLFYWYKTI